MADSLDTRLLVFTRAPVPGQVKTRLIPALGADAAADLHRRLTEQCLRQLCAPPLVPMELWVTPDAGHPFFTALAKRWPLTLQVQQGRDLGERLHHAARAALTRADAVILLGTDCPALDRAYLVRAIARLAGADAVLGPAHDGGYVLLGLRRTDPSLFEGIPWGGDRVAAVTRSRLGGLGWRWSELPALPDIDRPEDLVHLDAAPR
ncbi:MAG: TIGR04282 family arsenosugar biosynthesis glycosyltransferase [Thiohalocapsa sp.]|jgi:hypothetical protein|uniref:TIGR04282 family arsenosugar biosynthesis glycosyltransferase n=1 Tax=Thiohalocapsa sp. TaxID=2497641 RepID=UPI0025FD49F2|nr:TIGR04282 family arsenosugar biosynthesis glycosyltransferase [Thiohalocapsa sp.]MCG6940895.1 TIGR04282 family arsenosugar biosynthesis glycosyltransferase [Thiohalocapsa sp.]